MLRTEFDNDNGWAPDAAPLSLHCLASSHNVFTLNILLIRQSTRRKQGGVWAEQHAVRPETDQRRRRESDDVAAAVTPPPPLCVHTLSEMWVTRDVLTPQYCWRWTGFNFGFDLLVTYTNRFIVFKRNTLSQPCGGAVSLQPRRHLAYRSVTWNSFIAFQPEPLHTWTICRI